MLVLSNTNSQSVTANSNLTFNNEIIRTGSGCNCNNRGTFRVPKVSGSGLWEIEFHGNIAAGAATTAVTLAIAVDGVVLPETTMTATSTASGDVYNVSAATVIKVGGCPCAGSTITVVNNGAATVTVAANPALIIKRIG